MSNLKDMQTNRWYCFAHSAAHYQYHGSERELTLRIIQMMELAYGEGKREALTKIDQAIKERARDKFKYDHT